MPQNSWAILLCKFSDDDSEPFPRQRYEEIFTPAGAGKFNMVDFFRDMSHGKLDLSGSVVKGWYTLTQKRSDYVGSGANPDGRLALTKWAAQAALDDKEKFDVNDFFAFVVCMNVSTELCWVPLGNAVICDSSFDPEDGIVKISPSLLGQEMGHCYGLQHSRAAGSDVDYMDPFDTMSTRNAKMGNHPIYSAPGIDDDKKGIFKIGPGLNAANMWSRGWLDEGRIWQPDAFRGTVVYLRPLHRLDLSGPLVAQVGQYFLEFRMPELWDVGIQQPVVLLHDFNDGHSSIYTAENGQNFLIAGDRFERGTLSSGLSTTGYLLIEVRDIDPSNRIATVSVSQVHPKIWDVFVELVGRASTSDAGGIVLLNGKVVRLGPRTPEVRLLHELMVLAESEMRTGVARDRLERDAWARIAGEAKGWIDRRSATLEPAQSIQRDGAGAKG